MKPYEFILFATFILTARFKSKGTKGPFHFFLAFMMMVVLFELVFDPLYTAVHGNNYPVINLYTKLLMSYYLFVFYQLYKERKWAGRLLSFIIGYILITITCNFTIQDHKKLDILSYNVGFLVLLPMMLRYLYEVIYLRPYYNLLTDPYIYFVFGILIFYTSAFPILGFMNILITDNPHYGIYTHLLNVGNIFLSLAYLGAAQCSKYQTQSNPSSLHPS